jgi:GT2 family glycosyltransferase
VPSVQDKPTVDALIVSFNTKQELRGTLSSLLAHAPANGVDLRVSVFDNASSDGSAAMVATEFPQVELVWSEENLGFGLANNALARRSVADYLLFLNSDVVVQEDIITPLLDALGADARMIAVGPRLVTPVGRVQYSAHRLPTLGYEFARVLRGKRLGRLLAPVFDSEQCVDAVHEVQLTDRRVARSPEFLWATCWLMRRSDVGSSGPFDASFPMYDEDLDFCRRALMRGRALGYVPSAELVHIGGASTGSSAAKRRLEERARYRYYREHHGRWAAAVYRIVVPLVARLSSMIQRVPRLRDPAGPSVASQCGRE